MERTAREFLKKLVETPSPSGFEQRAQKLIRARLQGMVDEIRTDVHGNVMAAKNPDAPMRVMLSGHCDEIGLMITHVDDNGYIYFSNIGGIDPAVLPGHMVEIHSEKRSVKGVIGKKAIHLMDKEDVGKPMKLKQMWIDIGAKNRKDALKVVAVGDPITICRKLAELSNDLIAGRAFDNRVGAWVVVETMRRLHRLKLKCAVYGVTSVQEEIGLRGARTAAFGIDPQVGIAIDVTHASDHPDVDKKVVGEVSLGKGPVLHRGANMNPILTRHMEQIAKKKRIPFQMQAEPGATGTDANVIQVSRAGVATTLVSIPNRYMHTPGEVVSLKDLDMIVNLLVAAIAELHPRMDFRP